MNIAINGFGRIGRATFKAILAEDSDLNIVAINDLTDTKTLAYLLKHDSVYRDFEGEIENTDDSLIVNGIEYKVLAEKDPALLPWEDLEVDIVIESTGRFLTRESAGAHIKAGAKKVILSAPAKKGEDIKTIVLGVNEEDFKKDDNIVSMASCTTNCLAPVTEVIEKKFGIKKAIMTTVHSYTADQRLVDAPHKDLRRARSAAENIVPTTTGAAIATTETIPEIKGKFDGMSIRVPTPVVSLCDIVFLTKEKTTVEEVNKSFVQAARTKKKENILEVTNEPLVSTDFIGNPASSIVDLSLTKVVDGDLVKVIAWYDNEWGYSCRLADLCEYIQKKGLI